MADIWEIIADNFFKREKKKFVHLLFLRKRCWNIVRLPNGVVVLLQYEELSVNKRCIADINKENCKCKADYA